MLGAALLPLAALLPIIGVESAPECPDAASLVESLELQIDATGRASASEGSEADYVLRVDAPTPERLRVQVADPAGRVVLARDLPAANATCDARARAVAIVIDRWLAALPVPPAGLARASVARDVTSRRPARLDVHGGPALTMGVDELDAFAGLELGVGIRPLPWIRVALDGVIDLPRDADVPAGTGSVTQGGLRLGAAVVPWDRALRVEVGPTFRLALTRVSVSGVPGGTAETRARPAIGASAGLWRGVWIGMTADGWLALDGDTYFVVTELGRQDVYRTPRAGLELDLQVGYDLL